METPYQYRGQAPAMLLAALLAAVLLSLPGGIDGFGAVSGLPLLCLMASTVLGLGALAVILFLDWRGVLLLRGRVSWATMRTGKRALYVVVYCCFAPLLFLAYVALAVKDYYRTTQDRPREQARHLWQRMRKTPRAAQAGMALALLLAACGYAASIGAALGEASPTAPQIAVVHGPQWTTVRAFHGSGSGKTAIFTVPSASWRIIWQCDLASASGPYTIGAAVSHPDGSAADPAAFHATCQPGNTYGVVVEHLTSGQYDLAITSAGGWILTIQVYEERPTA